MSALVVGTLTRANDVFDLTLYSWSSSNTWQTILTPAAGEGGEIWVLFNDTADSDKKRFQMWAYFNDGTTINLSTDATTGIVDIGSATVKAKLQISTGNIQILHTAGANRTCTAKVRTTTNV